MSVASANSTLFQSSSDSDIALARPGVSSGCNVQAIATCNTPDAGTRASCPTAELPSAAASALQGVTSVLSNVQRPEQTALPSATHDQQAPCLPVVNVARPMEQPPVPAIASGQSASVSPSTQPSSVQIGLRAVTRACTRSVCLQACGVVCLLLAWSAVLLSVSSSKRLVPFAWREDTFARDVFIQARQPCTRLTQAELAQGELFGGLQGTVKLNHVRTLLCDELSATNAVALPLYAFGWEFNRCIVATRADNECLVLANPMFVHADNHVQAALTNDVLQIQHASRKLPLLAIVSAVGLGSNDVRETHHTLTNAGAVAVSHWLETAAQGYYADFIIEGNQYSESCLTSQSCDKEL